jgi:hypothetical protein
MKLQIEGHCPTEEGIAWIVLKLCLKYSEKFTDILGMKAPHSGNHPLDHRKLNKGQCLTSDNE